MIMMMMSDVTTGRHDDTPAADEGVRGADVESGQDPPEPRGDISNISDIISDMPDLHDSIISSCVQVCRIYVGSFWNQPLQYTGNRYKMH